MQNSLDQLLAEANDFDLCNGVFCKVVAYHGDEIDAAAILKPERVVLLCWNAVGIIGNGGFQYLFENNILGDPQYKKTASAFQTVGCRGAIAAFR